VNLNEESKSEEKSGTNQSFSLIIFELGPKDKRAEV
jgi:hypothetical protein